MKKHLLTLVCTTILSISTFAQSGSGRVSLGTGLLYENGWDVTLAYEHETKYHNAWEFFGNVYLKWDECASCKHICPDSFWQNYRSYGVGAAYKPCVCGSGHGANETLWHSCFRHSGTRNTGK